MFPWIIFLWMKFQKIMFIKILFPSKEKSLICINKTRANVKVQTIINIQSSSKIFEMKEKSEKEHDWSQADMYYLAKRWVEGKEGEQKYKKERRGEENVKCGMWKFDNRDELYFIIVDWLWWMQVRHISSTTISRTIDIW